MKFSYTIDPVQRIVFQRYEGECSVDHVMASIRRLWSDPAYAKTFGNFIDLSAAIPRTDFTDLHRLIAFLSAEPLTSSGRCAAVTNSPMITACGLLYQKAMANRHAFSVFSSTEAALIFLQIKGPLPAWSEQPAEEIAV